MKTIYKMTVITVVALMINIKTSAGQEPTTRESIGKQYVNNKVPGLKYGPISQSKRSIQSVNSKQNTTGNIRDVLFTGGVPKAKSAASRKTNVALAKSSNAKLTSDAKAAEPEKDKQEVKPNIPSQGDVKEPSTTATIKTTPVNNGKKKTE